MESFDLQDWTRIGAMNLIRQVGLPHASSCGRKSVGVRVAADVSPWPSRSALASGACTPTDLRRRLRPIPSTLQGQGQDEGSGTAR